MDSRPRWLLRVVATGLSFFVFGVTGLVLGLAMWPVTRLLFWRRRTRAVVSRWCIRLFFRFFLAMMQALGLLTLEVRGREKLARRGLLVLANHPTLIDVIILVSLLPEATCVVRAGLMRNVFTRGPLKAAGYIMGDDGQGLLDGCRRAREEGSAIVLFPEGTRTPRDKRMQLKRGGANVAIRTRWPVTPVIMRCEPLTLGKGEPWYRVPPRKPLVTVDVRDDWAIEPFLVDDTPEPVAVRALTSSLQSLFEQEA